jgi:hypothetical protein
MAMLVSKMKKGKKVKTRGEFAPAKNQLFSPAFFHESREINCYGRSSGLRPNLLPSHSPDNTGRTVACRISCFTLVKPFTAAGQPRIYTGFPFNSDI